ncbi:helix-turn-helix domain-containing protein [Streptosporangium sp. NPDC020072]|uniref:helix-turn-helix domain-containing protein n=1 Tax=Streptosporangium sp. NPDC020072 TaxID=3154788 RepID=UPI00343BB5EB
MIFAANDLDLEGLDDQELTALIATATQLLNKRLYRSVSRNRDLVGTKDAAEIMGFTRQHVRRLCREGRLIHRRDERGAYLVPRLAATTYTALQPPQYHRPAAPTQAACA